MNASTPLVSIWATIGLLASTAVAVDIETVAIGDRGNTADKRYIYGDYSSPGSVAYGYNIGKYEVTAGQYTAFLNAVAGVDLRGLYSVGMAQANIGCGIMRSGTGTTANPFTYSVAPAFTHRPVTYVSWGDAARFANWLHNGQPAGKQDLTTTEDGAYYLNGATTNAQLMIVERKTDWRWAVPTRDEWYKAAYYKGGSTNAGYFDYPTGSNEMPGRDLNDVSGNNANYLDLKAIGPIQPPYYTTVVGEFQNSDSPYGTFDQAGNVFEWIQTTYAGTHRGMGGGSFNSTGGMSGSFVTGTTPTTEEYYIGLRLVAIPEPATITMLVLLGFVTLRQRRA